MALDTFTNLKAAIITHGMRDGDTEFETAVPDFITGCEQLMNYGTDDMRPIRTAEMETTATITLTNGVGTLPTDYLQWRSIKGSAGGLSVNVEVADPAYVNRNVPNGVTSSGSGLCTISGSTITLYDSGVTSVSLTYYAKIPALSVSNPTNWMLTKYPMAYLYGALIHSAPFMMDSARIQEFWMLYKQSVGGLINSDLGARYASMKARVRGYTP